MRCQGWGFIARDQCRRSQAQACPGGQGLHRVGSNAAGPLGWLRRPGLLVAHPGCSLARLAAWGAGHGAAGAADVPQLARLPARRAPQPAAAHPRGPVCGEARPGQLWALGSCPRLLAATLHLRTACCVLTPGLAGTELWVHEGARCRCCVTPLPALPPQPNSTRPPASHCRSTTTSSLRCSSSSSPPPPRCWETSRWGGAGHRGTRGWGAGGLAPPTPDLARPPPHACADAALAAAVGAAQPFSGPPCHPGPPHLQILVIAVLLRFVMRRSFNVYQWEALFLLVAGITGAHPRTGTPPCRLLSPSDSCCQPRLCLPAFGVAGSAVAAAPTGLARENAAAGAYWVAWTPAALSPHVVLARCDGPYPPPGSQPAQLLHKGRQRRRVCTGGHSVHTGCVGRSPNCHKCAKDVSQGAPSDVAPYSGQSHRPARLRSPPHPQAHIPTHTAATDSSKPPCKPPSPGPGRQHHSALPGQRVQRVRIEAAHGHQRAAAGTETRARWALPHSASRPGQGSCHANAGSTPHQRCRRLLLSLLSPEFSRMPASQQTSLPPPLARRTFFFTSSVSASTRWACCL